MKADARTVPNLGQGWQGVSRFETKLTQGPWQVRDLVSEAMVWPANPAYTTRMTTARRYRNTYADYLRLQSESPLKLEFSEGEIFAMAGGTPEHGALAMQFVRLISGSLPEGCVVYSSDVKVRVLATDLATYPDLSIVCGRAEPALDDANAILNPRFLVEVTSASTEEYDRGDKLSQYKQLPSLQAVAIVSHRRRQVTVVTRTGASWSEKEVRAGERVSLGDGISFDVADLYTVAQSLRG